MYLAIEFYLKTVVYRMYGLPSKTTAYALEMGVVDYNWCVLDTGKLEKHC